MHQSVTLGGRWSAIWPRRCWDVLGSQPVRIRHVKLHKVLFHQPLGMGWVGCLVLHYTLHLIVLIRGTPIICSCYHIVASLYSYSI